MMHTGSVIVTSFKKMQFLLVPDGIQIFLCNVCVLDH